MSFEQLLTRTATIIRRGPETAEDDYGDSLPVDQPAETHPAYLEQTAGVEVQVGRDSVISDALLVLGPDVDLAGVDRVDVDGQAYEVIGPPARVERPGYGTHHIEARLRAVVSG